MEVGRLSVLSLILELKMYTLQFSRQQYFSFISLLDLPTYFLTPAYSVFVCLETMLYNIRSLSKHDADGSEKAI